jgi:dynamin-binding protein
MESGIKEDQNFYSRHPLAPSPDRPHLYSQPPDPTTPDRLDPSPFTSTSPEVPPKLSFLTAANLQAVTSNGFGTGLSEGSDPDEFYREFRSPQQLSNGYSDSPLDDMATKTSAQRHPSIPVARNNLRPSYRSASEPVNERAALGNSKAAPALNGTSQYGKPSVKDLLKRFDQNNEPSTPIARKPAPRLAAKDSPPTISGHARERVGYQARTTTSPQTNGTRPVVSTRYAGPVTAKSPTKSPASRPTHRTRFATEDKDSNKPLSISTHTTRPKNPGPGTNKQASKSMVNLSPTAPNPPSAPPTRKPLFGEILPLREAPELGYGISRATRRTSDSGLHPPASLRDQSNRDISPSSPTAWYLGVTPALEDADPNKARNISLSHNRNHSDSADNSVNTRISVDPTPFITSTPNAQMHEAARSASRLPLSSNKPSDRSGSSSPTSPISNTSITKKSHVTARRKPDQSPWNSAAAGRAVTPISRNTTPGSAASPPRQSPRQSPRRAKVPEKLNTNPSSLKAYISAPPPKQSPPLRSSRPRLPVSSASASSPRQNYTDASGSPQHVRSTVKATRTGGTNEPRPRKIVDNGPVDFVARRERIQRAYTKSIQESEQREIRAANLRRLQERQARAAEEKEEREREAGPPEEPAISESIPESTNSPAKPLQITTSFFLQEENVPAADQDSPTLGMPGGFVDDEEPASAVTDATATTEFDNEQQTEAPQLSRMPITQPSGSTMTSSIFQWNDLSVDQASFGMVHLLNLTPNSANASGHASPIEEHQPEHTPTNDLFEEDPSIPGAFKHDSVEYNQPIFATTVTTPSPEYAPPPQSRSFSNHISSTASDDAQQLDTSQIHPPPRILLHPESETTDANNLSGPHTNQLPLGTKDILEYLRSPSTEPNYESSDGYGGMNNSEPDSYEAYEQVQDGRSPSQNHISSYRSSWTNESIGTTGSSGQGDYVSSPPVRATSEPEQKPTSAPGIYSPPTKLSSQISTDPSTETPGLADPSSHMDVASSTDDGFGITFADPAPVPLWPNYSPPPPPDPPQQDHESSALPARSPPPSLYNKRPASTLYQSSQNDTGRNTESPRASDDTYSARASVYTPRSSTQISLEGSTANQSFDSKEASVEPTEEDKKAIEKLKKRLFQRRMLIKELIDTESVYLKDMNVVEEIYKGTAEACPNMDTNDIKAIFRNSDEIVAFSTMFLDELKSAGSSVYSTRSQRKSKAVLGATMTTSPAPEERFSVAATLTDETDDQRDRRTFIGANFGKHLKRMQTIYTDFLKNSEQASSKLTVLQSDSAVKVWLSECNLVAKDLTAAWDLDALLVKPVQRITRYQLLLAQIFEHTSEDHPDWQALRITVEELAMLLKNIDDLKKRIQMVGKIVGRKRKESDVRSGIAKAFGRRTDKLQAPNISRPHDDEVYLKLHEKFGDDYLRLQVVLRDVEYYTRETTTYVRKFLEHLSSIELIMRIGASSYPELESKWVRFNISMRDMGTVALEDHVSIPSALQTRF